MESMCSTRQKLETLLVKSHGVRAYYAGRNLDCVVVKASLTEEHISNSTQTYTCCNQGFNQHHWVICKTSAVPKLEWYQVSSWNLLQ